MSNNQSRQNQQQSIPPTNQPLVDQLTHLLGQLTSVGEMTDARRKRLLDFAQQWEQNDPSTLGKVITAILTIVGSVIIGGTFTGILSIIFELNSLYVLYIIIQLTFIGFGVSLHFLSRSQLLVLASVILILIGLLASGGVALVPDQGISSLILFPLWIVTFVLLTPLMRSDGITYINLLMAEIYLFAIILDSNQGSIRLLEKYGFKKWGHLPRVADFDGIEVGHLYYGLRICRTLNAKDEG